LGFRTTDTEEIAVAWARAPWARAFTSMPRQISGFGLPLTTVTTGADDPIFLGEYQAQQ